jgi:hypothetical protein
MIKLKTSKIRELWFAEKVSVLDAITFTKLKQYQKDKAFGFIVSDFYTKIIKLEDSIDVIFSNFKKNTKNEINRAEKEKVEFEVGINPSNFINFYNDFATQKSLKLLNNINKYAPFILITAAKYQDDYLCMHSYLIDESIGKVRLLHSASQFRTFEDQKKNLVGMSNRFLHFKDIQHFKNLGFLEYDLGGYAHDSVDKTLININKFKDSFGGMIKNEPELRSILFYVLEKLYFIRGSK